MLLRVLGCSGAEMPDFKPPAFLIDNHLLLDAGTIGSVLSDLEQTQITSVFITHSHLDHIRAIPALADNLVLAYKPHSVDIISTEAVISALKTHMFNGTIWPDFTRIPSPEQPVLRFNTLVTNEAYLAGEYSITAVPVNHTVPTVGFVVDHCGKRIVYTGDTGPTDELWPYCSAADALIVEVSFPEPMTEMALLTKHLTVALMATELQKIDIMPKRIFVTHPKPQYYEAIKREIDALENSSIELLRDGDSYEI